MIAVVELLKRNINSSGRNSNSKDNGSINNRKRIARKEHIYVSVLY